MEQRLTDIQQTITAAASPLAVFADLSLHRQREVFPGLAQFVFL